MVTDTAGTRSFVEEFCTCPEIVTVVVWENVWNEKNEKARKEAILTR
jgi:hypothetical protein